LIKALAWCRAFIPSECHLRLDKRMFPGPGNKEKYIVHFPESRKIWSYRFRLRWQRASRQKMFCVPRIASNIARDEGWMAEHSSFWRRRSKGEKTYVAAGVPQRLRQNQFRHAHPPKGFEGW